MQEGRLLPGSRLPSTRDFARQLRVARGTVVLAYDQLTDEGYLRGARSAGTVVVDSLPESWLSAGKARDDGPASARPLALSRRGELLALSPFRLERSPRPDRLRDGDARGYRPLREAIAEHLRVHRGVACSADRIVVAAGTQQLLDISSRLLLDEGDAVWMEDPGHFGARDVLRAGGARLIPVPVDSAGMDVEVGLSTAPEARLAYVTPARQSPLGAVLSLERRARLLEWARARSAWIFEDDYDSEFRYEGRPLPALQGLDRHGVVIYSGTFTKTVFPGLRLAFAVLPDALVDPFASALSLLARYTPVLPQLALCDFIAEGHFARHLRRMRVLYAERREALLDGLTSELGDQLEIVGSSAGLEVVARLPPLVQDRAVAKLAFAAGVDLLPLSRYAIRPASRGGLVLGFAAVSAARSRRAVPLLRAALKQVRRG
jgi:GntR family transcriptional regulator/MocR family aminotransferase